MKITDTPQEAFDKDLCRSQKEKTSMCCNSDVIPIKEIISKKCPLLHLFLPLQKLSQHLTLNNSIFLYICVISYIILLCCTSSCTIRLLAISQRLIMQHRTYISIYSNIVIEKAIKEKNSRIISRCIN